MTNGEQHSSAQRDGWDVVRDIVRELPDEQFDALVAALDQPVDRQSDLRRILKRELAEEFRDESNLLLTGVVAFLAGWMEAGRPKGLDDRIARRAFPEEDAELERAKAIRLVKTRAPLLAAGAFTAQRARGLNVMQVGVSLDLTPMNWSDEIGSALLPGFQLAIDGYDLLDPSTQTRQVVTLDVDDVRGLKKEIDEALEHLEKLQASYADRNIMIWGVREADQDE
ncbi:hypothetical protein M3A78_005100 [Micrococcus luteus]|nr:hypothetical protein [Micrococcus luteus]MCV7721452.1 hypothetical protein [Micrococcus luteus]MCV7734322.1 hypothetical protein [Micrococcus luteus]